MTCESRPEPLAGASTPNAAQLRRCGLRSSLTHHRKVRARKALTSPLDSVEGIGPARKRALLRHFGSVQAIREAPVDEIVKLGIPERLAMRLKETL